MIALIAGIVTIIGVIVAYKFNPKQRLLDQIDATALKIKEQERKRDEALNTNNTAQLSITTATLIELRKTQASLLKRFRENYG